MTRVANLSILSMPLRKHLGDTAKRETTRAQQYLQVITQIGGFAQQGASSCTTPANAVSTPSSPTFCAMRRMPLLEQPGRIAAGRAFALALLNQRIELDQETPTCGTALSPKQVGVPRWQIGPTGSANTSSVSASQSA